VPSPEIVTGDRRARDEVVLEPRAVVPRGRRRRRVVDWLGLAAVVALLAAGFRGIRGGAPAATGSATPLEPAAVATPTPIPCSTRQPIGPTHAVMLLDEASRVPGLTNRAAEGPLATDEPALSLQIPADTMLRLDVATGHCALGWSVSVDGYVVAEQLNPNADPSYALGRSFPVSLGPVAGRREVRIVADLWFLDGFSATSWRLLVTPVEEPEARITVERSGRGPLAGVIAMGCLRSLGYRNGYRAQYECSLEPLLPDLPTLRTRPGETLVFDFGGWSLEDGYATLLCGQAGGTPPTLMVDPTCTTAMRDGPGGGVFLAPPVEGAWLVAVSGCLTMIGDRDCGTWYLNLETAASS